MAEYQFTTSTFNGTYKILRELRIVTASNFQDKEKTLLKKIKKFLQTRNFYPFTIVS